MSVTGGIRSGMLGLLLAAGCGSSGAIHVGEGGAGGTSPGGGGGGGGSALGGMGGTAAPVCVAGLATGARVGLQSATATFSQTVNGAFSVKKIIDGITNDNLGWAIAAPDNLTVAAETAALQTGLDTVAYPSGTRLAFVFVQNFTSGAHGLGRFRISVTTADRTQFADGNDGSLTPGTVGANSIWTVVTPIAVCGLANVTMTVLDDSSVLVMPNSVIPMAYTVIADTALTAITGVRIETLKDPSLPIHGPGLQSVNGNFVLSEFQMYAEGR
jgi:hypothetical protein